MMMILQVFFFCFLWNWRKEKETRKLFYISRPIYIIFSLRDIYIYLIDINKRPSHLFRHEQVLLSPSRSSSSSSVAFEFFFLSGARRELRVHLYFVPLDCVGLIYSVSSEGTEPNRSERRKWKSINLFLFFSSFFLRLGSCFFSVIFSFCPPASLSFFYWSPWDLV